ncbi:MAG: PA0069 family radical SAM protein [Gammaproteobacteria bacterium]|nr:MAG: PA0069 family radical SAM protein [Gammaproteobacteria bacterium]
MKGISHKGRGALSNPANRFEHMSREPCDDGWGSREELPPPARHLVRDHSRSVIARNDSPDVPFDRSINPYRGCEHGCIYCFARPSHAWLGHSPGLEFETHLHYKPDAAERLREALARPGYRCQPIALGTNTDAYQPLERELSITRRLLEVLLETRHPVSLITKSALIERDLDLLRALAAERLVEVRISLTTLDRGLARRMEPRAAAPQRRLQTIERLAAAGIPVGVLVAPVIPFLNDSEMEQLLEAARAMGAAQAGYVMLRLPREVAPLFDEWLAAHYPARRQRVLSHIRACRGGALNDGRFGSRMRGEGPVAELIAARFRACCRRLDFPGLPPLDGSRFRPPAAAGGELPLFTD